MNPAARWLVGTPLQVDVLAALASAPGGAIDLEISPQVKNLNTEGRHGLAAALARDGVVYGVTTGFGDSCETEVAGALVAELPANLFRFHGCGVGPHFGRDEGRAILVARLASLATGYSAVRESVLQGIVDFLRLDITPLIPSLGSVGASGDLTPLSYLAATLCGEREVMCEGSVLPARDALARFQLEALHLEPKESLALMNGTSAMTGLAALCIPRALALSRWAAALSASVSAVLRGQPKHFDPRLFAAKPHPGQMLAATWIRQDLEFARPRDTKTARVQDRYSIRCAPHVIGVLLDILPSVLGMVEIELNSASDNPLVDPETGDLLHGGNFYGGHICSAMDTLKTQVANLVDLLDRQLALLCNPTTNHGLPPNLVGVSGPRSPAHHGFKAMQITTSALAAEAAKLTMPASVFSRSTENHNQDKVSMGTIAARDCSTLLDLAETTAAICTLAVAQAVDLRAGKDCFERALALHGFVRQHSPFVAEDRALDADIAAILQHHRRAALPIGSFDLATFRSSA